MAVLMLAHDTDEVAGQVAAELRTRGTEVARLNPSAFPSRLTMGARLRDSGTWGGLISDEDGPEVELAGIRAVWQRRASPFVMDERMSSPERAFAYGEARRGFGGVLTSLACCLWVNDPVAAARAAYKPLQLAQAAEVGLAVPATLITSEPRTAYNWAKELRRPIVYKPMNGVAHADEGQVRVVFTAPVADLESLLDPAFGLTAQMLQERVPKAFEARVTVVGSEMFAVRIDAGSTAAQEDWRSDYDALSYSIIELPPDLRAKLLKLMARLGLVYGAFSLLLFEVGRPGGSWAACDWEPGNRLYEVLQYGERRLWDELEDAFEWWVRHDGPGVDRFGLAVTPEGDRLWLDEPARLV